MHRPTVFILLLFACGDDSSTAPDATPTVDAPADPPSFECTPRGAAGSVTVEGPAGAPTLMVTVIAHDRSGAVISRSPVFGPDATAVVDVPSCGMVSVHEIDPASPGSASIHTWVNVQPGDRLIHVEHGFELVDRPIELQLAAFPDATSYRIMATCPGDLFPFTRAAQVGRVELEASCRPGARSVSVIAIATTPTGAAFAIAADVPLAASGTTTVTLPAYQASTQTVTATVRNADRFAGGDAAFGLFTQPAAEHALVVGERNAKIAPVTSMALPAIGGGAAYVSLRAPIAAVPDRLVSLARPFATFPAAIDLDLDTDFLPLLEATSDGVAMRPTVTWSASRALVADYAFIELDVPINATDDLDWTLVMPASPGVARFPAMPPDLLPAAAPRLGFIVASDSSTIDSYDEAREDFARTQLPWLATGEVRGTGVIYPAP